MAVSDPEAVDRSWRLWASIAVISVLGFSVVFGFVVLPIVQGYSAGIDPFTAICRAIGIQPGAPPTPQPRSEARAQPTTQVAWSADLIRTLARRGNAGAAVAQGCAACHGDTGVAVGPQFPNLAGQSALAIYKQLHDYKSGSRVHNIMTGMAQALADEDIVTVAGYFSSSTALALDPTSVPSALQDVKRLVERGDPSRGIPACNACHGNNAGGPIETPTLSRQSATYLTTQLQAFRAGDRRNDIYGRMRGIAAKLTDAEIDGLARFYAATSAY
ncbi:MAG: c-type cytochrome [Gemmatimonas sp.]